MSSLTSSDAGGFGAGGGGGSVDDEDELEYDLWEGQFSLITADDVGGAPVSKAIKNAKNQQKLYVRNGKQTGAMQWGPWHFLVMGTAVKRHLH